MAARATPHDDFESPPNADGGGLSPPSDPLQRLEAELGEVDGGQSGDERLYEEAQGLVEEAWNVLSECLSIREGLLDACREIERTMGGMQHRLSAMAVAAEPDGSQSPASDGHAVAGSSNGAVGR